LTLSFGNPQKKKEGEMYSLKEPLRGDTWGEGVNWRYGFNKFRLHE